MRVSVCITVLNEEKTISKLLSALFQQTKKPDEIVIVDAKSEDKTVEIINYYKKRFGRIKLFIEKCTRGRGRNLAVDLAKNEIIAMTDAGCVPKKDWLEAITDPFKTGEVDIVAGFYEMKALNSLERAFSVFLGVHDSEFDVNFLPSTRSLAFRKRAWELVAGFPEDLNTAEDTVFDYKAVKEGLKIARVKEAKVIWQMPKSLKEGLSKMRLYAFGDAKSRIWLHPTKGFLSHNIRVVLIFTRYIIGSFVLFYSFFNKSAFLVVLIIFLVYLFWAFRKVFIKTRDFESGLWGIMIQIFSDYAVMSGFISGLFAS